MNKLLMRTVSALNTCIYQVSGGRWLGRFPSGAPVCLLTTQGRKSGQRRTVPLLYLADGDDLVLVASQGGAPQHPGWYFNLVADPTAEVQVGRRRAPSAPRKRPRCGRVWWRFIRRMMRISGARRDPFR
jgi:deazaflavin-dependent oxidoreductase (nitroreductase family)